MRMSREQTAETRARILDVAGRLFRERGFDGIGVVDLMKSAGLTHGAFYNHFESKNALASEASEQVLRKTTCAWAEIADTVEFHAILTPAFHPILTPPVGV